MMNATINTQPSETAAGRLTVLVVDDHRYFRESLVSYLADFPIVSIAGIAANGAEAVEMAGKLRPQLVIMDIQMPELDGLAACELLKTSYPDMRVILYSMHEPETFSKEALNRADSFVPKHRLFEELTRLIINKADQAALRI